MYDVDWLRRRAAQTAPFEACGFVFDDGSIIEIRNVATNPMRGFQMDRSQLTAAVRHRLDDIVAIWHTHPSGISTPSNEDLRAINIGAIQRHWHYLIATAREVSCWNPNNFAQQDDSFWQEFAK